MKKIRNEVDHLYGLKYKATKAPHPSNKRKKVINEKVTLTFEGDKWTCPGKKAAELIVDKSSTLDTVFKIKTGTKTIKLDVCQAEEVLLLLVEHARQSKYYKYFRGKKGKTRYL